MAEQVEIPVRITVEDIELENVDMGDVQKAISSKVDGIMKSMNGLMANVDTSKFNKALTSAFSGLEKSYDKVETAQYRFNDALVKAGQSSEAYKARLAEVNSQIKAQQDIIKAMAPLASNPAAAKEIENAKQQIEEIKKTLPDPKDYVSSGSEYALTKLAQTYKNLQKAIQGTTTAQQNWKQSMKDNQFTDQYAQMQKDLQSYESKLNSVQAKAQKFNEIGASDRAWQDLIYDAGQLESKITETEAAMRRLVDSGKAFRMGNGGPAIGQQYMQLTGYITRLQKAMQNINSMKPSTMYSDEYAKELGQLDSLEKKVQSLKDQYTKMQASSASVQTWQRFNADADITKKKVHDITAELKEMVRTGKAFKLGTGDAQKELDALSSRLKGAETDLDGMTDNAKNVSVSLSKIGNSLKSSFRSIARLAKRAFGAVTNAMSSMAKRSGVDSHDFSSNIKRMRNNLLMLIFGVRSVIFAIRRLRSAFLDSMGQMAQQIPEVNTSVSSFLTSLNGLKGSLATAFQPIVSYIIPVLNKLISVLITAMEAVGRFFATLTGQGYIYKFTAAQVDYAASVDKTGKATDKANKKAKEYKNTLMGFDELNRLNEKPEDSGSGSGGAGGGGAAPMGTWTKQMIDGGNEFTKKLKDPWKKGDFYGVGDAIAEELEGQLKKLDDWINNKFRPWGVKWAGNIAQIVNGFFEHWSLWTQLGKTLSDGLAAVLDILSTFLEGVHFDSIGKAFGKALEAIFENQDMWHQISRFLTANTNAIIDLLWGFINETLPHAYDWGDTLSQTILDWFNGINWQRAAENVVKGVEWVCEFLEGFLSNEATWASVKQKISDAVDYLVKNIDLDRLATDISNLFTEVLDFLASLPWFQIGYKIGHALGEIDWPKILWDVGKIIVEALWGAIVGFMTSEHGWQVVIGLALIAVFKAGVELLKAKFLESALTSILSKALSASFGTAVAEGGTAGLLPAFAGLASKIGGFVTGTIIPALSAAGSAIASFLAAAWPVLLAVAIAAVVAFIVYEIVKHWDTISAAIKSGWEAVTSWFQGVWSTFSTWFSGVWQGLTKVVQTVWGGISSFLQGVWSGIVSVAQTIWGGLSTFLSGLWGGLVDVATTLITPLVQFFQGAWQAIVDNATIMWNQFSTMIQAVWELISTIGQIIWNGLSSFLQGVWNTLVSIGTTLWNGFASFMQGLWNGISSVATTIWNGISGFLQGAWNTIVSIGTTIFNGLATVLNSIWQRVSAFTSAIWNGIKGILSGIWNGIKSLATSAFNGIKSVIQSAWNGIKSITQSIWSGLTDWVSSKWKSLKSFLGSIKWNDIGYNLVNGLLSGIRSKWEALTSWVTNAAHNLTNKLKSAFDIHSPSKVWAGIGNYLVQGLNVGMEDEQSNVLKEAQTIAQNTTDALSSNLSPKMDFTTNFDQLTAKLNHVVSQFQHLAAVLSQITKMPQLQMMPAVASGRVVPNNYNAGTTSMLSEIAEAIADAVRNNDNGTPSPTGGNNPSVIRISIRGKEVFDAVVAENNSAIMRTGSSPLIK